ncbi:MAG: site-2 protease family protein [Anaerolineales bacterium]
MKLQSLRIGKLAGIPVYLDPSWFIIFVLLTWTLAASYFPAEFKGWPVLEYWIIGAITTIFLFVSVLLHELGHSVVALRYKVPVRKITLMIFGGVAQIESEPPHALAEFWIAIAGPAVSFALAGIFGLLAPAFSGITPVLAVAKYLAYINGVLGLFNLIPGFPLDGGRVFRAVVWGAIHDFRRATQIAANIGRLAAFTMILFGAWQIFAGNFGGGIWIAFIGWFLQSAANAQLQQQKFQDLLAEHTVSQAMSRSYTVLTPDTTFEQLMDRSVLGAGGHSFVIKDGEETIGLLTLPQIKQVPREQWAATLVGQKMIPINQLHTAAPNELLVNVIKSMNNDESHQILVLDGDNLLGILSRASLANFLRTLQELGDPQQPHRHLTHST